MPVEQGTASIGPITVQPTPRPKPPREQVVDAAEGIADAVMTVADRTRDIFRENVSQNSVQYAPDTTFWTAGVKNDPVTTAATDEALSFFATIYGGENLGAFLTAELLEDPIVRDRTFATVSYLRDQPQHVYQGYKAGLPVQAGAEELLQRVLEDPSAFGGMSPTEQAQVSGIADEFLAALQELPDAGLTADQLRRAIAIGATGDVSIALSESDLAVLRQLPKLEGLLGAGGTTRETPELNSVGIEQIRQLADGVIVLDLDEAQIAPDRAFAVKTWLEQNYPEMDVQYGRQGVVGAFLDKFGVAVDHITAPVGAGLIQLSELGERVGRTAQDKANYLAKADELEELIRTGQVDADKVEQYTRTVATLRDWGTDEVGWDKFKDQVIRNTRPRNIGFGFADSFTKASDLMPGDPMYGFAYAVSGLAANIIADPLNWLIPGIGAIKAGRHTPKFRAADILGTADDIADGLRLADPALDANRALAAGQRILAEASRTDVFPTVGRGWVKNALYRRLAKYPEELAVTGPHLRAASRLWRLHERLGSSQFSAAMGRFFAQDPLGVGGSSDLARYLSQATSEADMQWAMVRAQTGVHYTPPNLDELTSRLNDVTRQLDTDVSLAGAADEAVGLAAAERADLIAQRAFLVDTIKGRDWVRPMRQVFSAKQLRRLERLSGEPLGPQGKVLAAITDFTEKFPANIIRTFGTKQYRDPAAITGAQEVLFSLANMYRKTGAGEVLTFPHTSRFSQSLRRVGGEVLEDSVEESFGHITNIARFMGIPSRRINQLMGPWTSGELTSSSRSFQWWKDTWTTIVDESPKLTAVGKAEMRQMWHSLVSDRSPGYISSRTVGGLNAYEPTLYREIVDEATGRITQSGVPAFEADQFQSWKLPTIQDMRTHMTLAGRTMNDWAKTGGKGKRALSLAHLGLSQTWTSINQFWRTTTLGFRLFGALPARIGMEQMLRIAAYDYASAVWHPAEWFASTRVGTGVLRGADTALFTDSPVHALGTLINDLEQHPNFTLARAGRETVTLADGVPYYRSYSERLGRMYASPSVHEWHLPNLGDADRTLEVMRRHDSGTEWLGQYAEVGMDPSVAVARTQEEISQMLGTGVGRDVVRTALNRGSVTVGEQTYRVGTTEFGNLLADMAARGEWQPAATFLARSAGDYLPADRIRALGQFRDNLFRWFYSAPDLATARSPLYRQMAAREFRNLIRRGYTPENALRLARAHAARGTADMMFTIGAKTSGEYFLRNINPFFPAYRELATTWLKRLPLRVGEGHWALGSATIVRRADIWLDFFKNMGVVRTDEQGKLYVPLPGLDKAVALLTGANIGFDVRAPLESFAGVLPVPLGLLDKDENGEYLPWHKRLKGIMPTLGGPSSVALGMLNEVFHGAFDSVEDWTTLYGSDQSLGPLAVDRFFEAFGTTTPFMTNTTANYHEAVRTWAMVDGMRIAWGEMPDPPAETDFDSDGDGDLSPEEQRAWNTARTAWTEDLLARGERYAMGTYFMRGIAGMTLPFSIQVADEGKQKMEALWGLINALPTEGRAQVGPISAQARPGEERTGSLLIDSVLAEYPNLGPYLTGKTQDTRLVDDPDESLDEFMDAVKSGEVEVRSAQDWAVFALGMNSYSIYQSRLDAIYEEAGGTFAERLVNFDAKEAAQQEHRHWQDFLDLSTVRDNFLPGQTQSFMDMFETYQQYKRIRDGDTPRLSLQQQAMLDFDRSQREFAKYFSPNPESSDEYFKLKDEAYAALGNMGAGPFAQASNWWYDTVQSPYYDRMDVLWAELDITPKRDMALVFQKMRELSAEYAGGHVNPNHPEWGEFPSPEEYSFLKLSKPDQDQRVVGWASLPASFLTEFQREQVGYTIPEGKQEAADKLAALMTRGDYKLKKAVVQADLSFASTDVIRVREALDQFYGQRAREMGLGDYWRELNQPEYQRIGSALNLGARTQSWGMVASWADQLRSALEAGEHSPGGTSDEAKAAHRWFVDAVAAVRRNDAEFDSIMYELGQALGEEGQPLAGDDLYLTLYFDMFSTSDTFYLD